MKLQRQPFVMKINMAAVSVSLIECRNQFKENIKDTDEFRACLKEIKSDFISDSEPELESDLSLSSAADEGPASSIFFNNKYKV